MSPQIPLDIDTRQLRVILDRAEREGRHVSDDELRTAMSPNTMLALGAGALGSAAQAHASNWYDAVIAPMGLTSDEQREHAIAMYCGELTIADYVDTLSDDEASLFVEQYPALAEKYASRIARRDATHAATTRVTHTTRHEEH